MTNPTFSTLGVAEPILRSLTAANYIEPTPIQAQVIPAALSKRDILGIAQTGTGKTAGFTLPMLQILIGAQQLRRRPIRALILTPTRELAAQVYDNIKSYSSFLDIRSTVIFGV